MLYCTLLNIDFSVLGGFVDNDSSLLWEMVTKQHGIAIPLRQLVVPLDGTALSPLRHFAI